MATAEYIGALISLISKSDIRYQGLLAAINPEQATIALEKVRSWGTEGRLSAQGRPSEEISPSDHVYEYIMFRAADVKDLKIDDPNPPKQQQPALNDPAILNTTAPQSGPGGFGTPPAYGMMPPPPFGAAPFPGAPGFVPPPQQFNGAPAQQSPLPASSAPAAASKASDSAKAAKSPSPPVAAEPAKSEEKSSADKVLEEMSKLSVSKPSTFAFAPSPSALPKAAHGLPAIPHAAAAAANAAVQSERRAGGGRGAHHNNTHHHQPRQPRAQAEGPSMPNKEFDFESANAKFQKHHLVEEANDASASASQQNGNKGGLLDAIPPPVENAGNFYDKKLGFFDNISSEVKERYERTNPSNAEGGERNGFFDAPGGRGGRGGRGGGGRGRGRANRIAEEAKNMQTFGDTGASVGGSGGRGRGRGRGGFRGRGRGGPRGGAANGGVNTGPMRMD